MADYPSLAKNIVWSLMWRTGERDKVAGLLGKYYEDLTNVCRLTSMVTYVPVKFNSKHPIIQKGWFMGVVC